MPPKNKYTKQQIIDAAIEIVREEGALAVTARSVAAKLGCSVAPIFSFFEKMDELQAEIKNKVKEIYYEYVNDGLKEDVAFKGVGLSYIKFAMEEPNLFKLLFMSNEGNYSLDDVLSELEVNYEGVFKAVQDGYGLNNEDSKKLYQHMWIYTHGIAVLCVTGTCTFTPQEISQMISEVCASLVKDMRSKND
ncbi:MAG: TetR/AcrR family transcriptional regulator [Candidatus Coproplasma sp.]